MNMTSSSSSYFLSSSFAGSSTSSSSSSGPICASAPIVLLRVIHDNDSLLVNDTAFVLTERDIDHLHNHRQISRVTFGVYNSHPNIRINDRIPAENTIMVYEKPLKVGLQFSMDLFFVEVLCFHKLSVTQLNPNSWKILVAFYFVCFINHIELSVALFSQLY